MGLEIRTARGPEEIDAAYELAAKVFGPDYFTSLTLKALARRLEPIRDYDDVVVAVAGGDVVGLVRIVGRTLAAGRQRLAVGGITSVCLRPDVQGRGYGRALMDEAIATCRRRGDVVSIAFGRRAVDGFYPRLGYVGIGCHPELAVAVDRADAPPAVRRGFRTADVGRYAAAFEATYGEILLALMRHARWWDGAAERLRARVGDEGFHVVEDTSGPVGYFVVHAGRIVEAASTPTARPRLLAAVGVARTADGVVRLGLPVGHWLMAALRRRNHTLTIRCAWDGGHLLRVLDARVLITALADATGGDVPDHFADALRAGATDDHTAARRLLERLAGLDDREPRAVLQPLPSWSMVDEF
jgi:GNAT superfamily N-acetyltransferase